MVLPKAYLTRKLPEEARAIIAATCEFTEWPEEQTPVPRDEQ
jgi:hypothetical protein